MRKVFALTIAVALAATLSGTALAAKGGSGSNGKTGASGSLSLVMVADVNANAAPNWGDTVTFTLSTTATAQPHVSLKCSQNAVLVYSAAAGFYASYPWPWTQNMPLSSMSWTGGAADCVATLYYINGSKTVTLGTLSFVAEA